MKQQQISYLLVLILISALVLQCNKNSDTVNLEKLNTNALTDSVMHYKNSLGTQTAAIQTLQLDNKQLQELILNKDDKLNKLAKDFINLKSLIKTNSIVTFDTITTRLETPIASCDTIDSFIRSGKINSEWYSLNYKITNDSLTIAPFKTWTETTTITGVKRKWFLGQQSIVTDVTNSNPYITITNIKAAEVIVHEPWYRKWYIWLAAGIVGGIFIK